MTQPTLNEVLEKTAEFAVSIFNPKEETTPHFIAHAGGEVYVYCTPFTAQGDDGGEATKVAVLGFLRKEFKSQGVTAYGFISEAWIVTNDNRTEPAIAKLQPRQRSDRKEVLHVIAADANEAICAVYEIDRLNEPHLKLSDNGKPDRITGRMTDLLR